ncbi:MAG: amidohydrolase family protein [Ignavibacteriota bacterium]|nr:amidohydrolase family protein [Ignavibacteriales bacterium]MBL1122700.1 amidohydrolase [Ignavibacteriota bacterium]QKJ95074.1 MAG: amidohydrolase family protein [Ignavibacteriota bacterium]
MKNKTFPVSLKFIYTIILLLVFGVLMLTKGQSSDDYLFNDSHFHITNYIQEGIDINFYVDSIMGNKVGRSTLFGIPLQQQWSYRVTENIAPTYYLDSDAPLYYYSFTDAVIAMMYTSLPEEKQKRLDPMITGFNPTDMYAVDHIKRVLKTFPGVFTGIGEFTIHKEFVSSKISGDVASYYDPALDRIFEFCAESGLLVLIHNDIDNPFPKPGKPNYLTGMIDLIKRHPNTTTIWAHCGLGRIVHPVEDMAKKLDQVLQDPDCKNLYFDISWDEVAKWIMQNDTSVERTAGLIKKYPDRFLFGTDNVAPDKQEKQLYVYHLYDRLWKAVGEEVTYKVCIGNYEKLFNEARVKVRNWEKENIK